MSTKAPRQTRGDNPLVQVWQSITAKTNEKVNPTEFFKAFSDTQQDAKDREFRRGLLKRIANFLMVAFAASVVLIFLHSLGAIELPQPMVTSISVSVPGEILGLLAVIIHGLFRRI